jgi:lipid-binding SYLF domain-containing protein
MPKTITRLLLVAGLALAACATAPKTQGARFDLQNESAQALQTMMSENPSLYSLLDRSAGYIVFPAVKEGGFIVGGSGARGVVFQGGRQVGFAQLSRASFGAQVGGQKYAELVVLRDQATLDRLKQGDFDFSGEASAVIIKQGVATNTEFGNNGIAVFIKPLSGAMVNASIGGQRIKTQM